MDRVLAAAGSILDPAEPVAGVEVMAVAAVERRSMRRRRMKAASRTAAVPYLELYMYLLQDAAAPYLGYRQTGLQPPHLPLASTALHCRALAKLPQCLSLQEPFASALLTSEGKGTKMLHTTLTSELKSKAIAFSDNC